MQNSAMKTIADLYKHLDPFDQRKPLCSMESSDGSEIILRYFSPARDLLFMYQWVNSQFERHFTEGKDFSQSLYDYYVKGIGSDIVQCFMVMCNNDPIMQVDILNGLHADLKHDITTNGSDGILQCFITPDGLLPVPVLVHAMELCLAWFLSFNGLHRVLTEIHASDAREQQMLIAAGFRLMPLPNAQPAETLLYYFSEDEREFSHIVWRNNEANDH